MKVNPPAKSLPPPQTTAPRHNSLPPTIWRLQTEHWRIEGRNAASDELVGGSQGSERVLVLRAWPISDGARLALSERGVVYLVQACQLGNIGALVDRWQVVAGEGASQLAREDQAETDGAKHMRKRRRL